MWYHFSVDTRCRFNVVTTSYDVVRRRIDVETKSCVYRVMQVNKHEKQPWRSVILVSNFIKSNTTRWVLFKFFKLYKWYKTAQRITHISGKPTQSWRIEERSIIKKARTLWDPLVLDAPKDQISPILIVNLLQLRNNLDRQASTVDWMKTRAGKCNVKLFSSCQRVKTGFFALIF